VERLEEGKKDCGKIYFPLFGTPTNKNGKKVSGGVHTKILSPLD